MAHGHLRQRLLLASARGVQDGHDAKVQLEFWQAKFDRNVARDKKEHAALKAAGWHVIVLWECEVKKRLASLVNEIRESSQ